MAYDKGKASVSSRKRKYRTSECAVIEERIHLGIRGSSNRYAEYNRNVDFARGVQDASSAGMTYDRRTAIKLRQNLIIVNRVLPILAEQNADIMPRIPWFYLDAIAQIDDTEDLYLRGLEGGVNMLLRLPENRFLQQGRLALTCGSLGIGTLKISCCYDMGEDPDAGKPEETGEIVRRQDPVTGQELMDIKGGDPLIRDGDMVIRRNGRVVLDKRNPGKYFKIDAILWNDLVFDPE